MNNIDILKQLKNLENLELTANNVKMEDGTNVEENFTSLKDRVLGDNEKITSEHFVKSYPEKYFSSVTDEKDLNNIKFNLICYTASADNLLNLPSNEGGGKGMLEVTQTYMNSGLQHTIQRYTNTGTSDTYIRTYNKDSATWTEWRTIQNHKLTNNDGTAINISKSDLNSLTKSGNYTGNNLVNAPTTNWAIVEVTQGASGIVKQIFTETTSTNQYMRIYRSNAWTDWRLL